LNKFNKLKDEDADDYTAEWIEEYMKDKSLIDLQQQQQEQESIIKPHINLGKSPAGGSSSRRWSDI